jgi:hypothetical protein
MKYAFLTVFYLFSLFACSASCNRDNSRVPPNPAIENNNNDSSDKNNTRMKIKIGSSTFAATLFDNATVTAFKAMLPITVNMTELNGDEKYFDLSTNLPANASNPSTIQNGGV